MDSTKDFKADPPAVHSVDEFVFSVPELAVARHFYASFGLDVRDEGDALALYTYGNPHRWGRIWQNKRDSAKHLLWLSFGIHAADLQRFERHLVQHRVGRIDAPPNADAGGLWLRGPDDLPIQLRVAEKCSPSQAAPREFPPACCGLGRAPSRSAIEAVRPLYLSHILLFSTDVDRAVDFYSGVLGVRVSDRSGSIIAFMHTPHGSDHHLVALAHSNGRGLHHSSWCVPSIDAVGLGAEQMTRAGYERGWGIGRHVLGSNYFRYVRDPWGSYAEYSFDIDFVAPGTAWIAADHPAEDSIYVWGPAMPTDFVVNYEAQ